MKELSNQEIINRLSELQGNRSDADFARKLGIHSSNWGRLKVGTYAAKNLDRIMQKLADSLRLLEDVAASGTRKPILRLSSVKRVLDAVASAFREERMRLITVLSDTGQGKTSIAKVISEEYGSSAIQLTATESWCTYTTACINIAKALGIRDLPRNKSTAEDAVINALKSKGGVLVVDEAHHLGAKSLNLIKHIINACPEVVIVILSIPHLWSSLENKEFAHAVQLKSRCLAKIVLKLTVDDIDSFLSNRIKGFSDWDKESRKAAARKVYEVANTKYSLVTVEMICSIANEFTDEAMKPEVFTEAISLVEKSAA